MNLKKYISELNNGLGKEFIINSLGLVNSKNDNKDGLVIFGDVNVRIYIIL